MSISTNIDGSVGGANQLLDLLSLVSNPSVYQAKINDLQAATEENKKYVELVGPASEIVKMRDDMRLQKESADAEAKQIIDSANQEAESIKTSAKKYALDAKAEADNAVEKAKALNDAAQVKLDELKAKSAAADNALASANSVAEEAAKELELAKAEKQASLNAKASYEAAKASIIAKHKAFIESL